MKFNITDDLNIVRGNYHLISDKDTLLIRSRNTYNLVRLKRDSIFYIWSISEIFRDDIASNIMRGITYLVDELNQYATLLNEVKNNSKK